jgi:hypothetical protein
MQNFISNLFSLINNNIHKTVLLFDRLEMLFSSVCSPLKQQSLTLASITMELNAKGRAKVPMKERT